MVDDLGCRGTSWADVRVRGLLGRRDKFNCVRPRNAVLPGRDAERRQRATGLDGRCGRGVAGAVTWTGRDSATGAKATNPIFTQPASHLLTAFDEQRVAQPFALVDLVNKYEIDANTYSAAQVATGGTVTHVPLQSAIQFSVTGASGSSAALQTKTYYRYQAGRGTRIRTTINNDDAGQANQVRRWGLFDANDGLFYELSGTTLRVVQRSSTSGAPVDTAINQSVWNHDKLDGTGPSGVTLDVTKGIIFEITFQWLGVGDVSFFINGILVHKITNANVLTVPYMRTAQLPLRWEVTNTGASTGSGFRYVCASVQVDGGVTPPRYAFNAFNASDKSLGGTEIPMLAIRLAATYNAITNRMLVHPFLLAVSTETQRAGFRVLWNPATLTGPVWVAVDATSGVERDVTASAFTGGTPLLRTMVGTGNGQAYDIKECFDFGGRELRYDSVAAVSDVLLITGINEGGGSTNGRASLTWHEFR